MPLNSALVTGADGFIGSHLTEALLRAGVQVIAVIRRASATQVGWRLRNLDVNRPDGRLSVIAVDLAGPDAVSVLAPLAADTWFHLAADAYVPASLAQPTSVVRNNLLSTANVLEAARRGEPSNLVVVSSSEVYGGGNNAINEDHALMPRTPYAASKLAADRLAYAYGQTFGTKITIARPFNCYGPRHLYDFVPIFLIRAALGLPLVVHGSGQQSRDLTYVDDTVEALIGMGSGEGQGEVFNIGSGRAYSVLDVAQRVSTLVSPKADITFDAPRSGDVNKLLADCRRLENRTGWRPQVSLADGLARSMAWVRAQVDASGGEFLSGFGSVL
jgi:nucleoside-diphosphate-sugar epimerase